MMRPKFMSLDARTRRRPACKPRRWSWSLLDSPVLPIVATTFCLLPIDLARSADCNANGVEDVVDLQSLASEDCNRNGLPDECEGVGLDFGVRDPEPMSVPETPQASTIGDLNDDGAADLVVLSQTGTERASFVSVILSREDGTLAPPVSYDALTEGTSIAVADIDGDNAADVVTANSTQLLLFRNLGLGTLATAETLPVEQFTRTIVADDVTGDDRPDLITANSTGGFVSVLANDGSGSFGAAISYAVSGTPIQIRRGDIDGDGDIDLVIPKRSTPSASILTNDGEGLFVTTDFPLPGRPSSVELVDLDTDGHLDLLVLINNRQLTWWTNSGAGEFASPTDLALTARTVNAGDFDRDGDIDLIVGNADFRSVTLLTNNDRGDFGLTDLTTVEFRRIQLGDFDGDGDEDVAFLTPELSSVNFLWNGERQTFNLRFFGHFPVGIAPDGRPHGAATGDVNGDGRVDVITANGPDLLASVFLSEGDGTLTRFDYETPTSRVEFVEVSDLDLDDDLDLVMTSPRDGKVVVLKNPGDGTFPDTKFHDVGASPIVVLARDVDGDDVPDVLTMNSGDSSVTILKGLGDTTFGARRDTAVGVGDRGLAADDFDGDGDIDIAVVRGQTQILSLLANRGDGTFDPPDSYNITAPPGSIACADLNGDSAPDFVIPNGAQATIAYFLNRGDGTLDRVQFYSVGEEVGAVTAADINSDGHADLLTANLRANSVSIIVGNGDGTFSFPQTLSVGDIPLRTLGVDLNLDGNVDVVSTDHDGRQLTVFLNEVRTVTFDEDFLESICTGLDFERISVASRGAGIVDRAGKYVMPATGDADLLPTLYQNSRRFQLHQEFLAAVFPDRFPALTIDDFNRLVARRAERQYFVGVISRLRTADGLAYGFDVFTDPSSEDELLSLEEVAAVRADLSATFSLQPLGYFPSTRPAREAAAAWRDPGFPVFLDDGSGTNAYVPYTQAVGFGRVRVLDADGFEAANDNGQIGFQNILVLDEAPPDIEGVVGGVITGTPQGELSHLAIRTARRNTPNAFVEEARVAFSPFEGKLIRLEVGATEFRLREATVEEAEEFWSDSRPQLSTLPEIDREFDELSSLGDMDLSGTLAPPEARFGGKASNLARLGRILEGPWAQYREHGFAIPARYFFEFMRGNRMPSALDPAREVTYEEHLLELFSSDEFQSNSEVRFAALDAFRDFARQHGEVDPALVERLVQRIGDVFGSTRTSVRFRSSSNVEDALEFNGAGLYESTGVCADDTLDADDEGPSLCDASKSGERTIRRALKKVWTSLYTFRAYEERSFFGVPESDADGLRVGMGILVSRAFLDEAANGVAFTGNLSNPLDRRYVVTVQVGEASVVQPEPGVLAEKDVLEVLNGEVLGIIRPLQGSTLLPEGEWVLSDAELSELGRLMWHIDANFPLELGTHSRDEVLLDMEIKLEPDGSLAVKQVRPFLHSVPIPPTPSFELEIPPGSRACGVFHLAGSNRGLEDEYRLKSVVELRSGRFQLDTTRDTISLDLVDELRLGPDQESAVPASPGLLRVLRVAGDGDITLYRFTYRQSFVLADGSAIDLALTQPLEYRARGDEAIDATQTLNDAFFVTLVGEESLRGSINDLPLLHFGSCSYDDLPLWEIAIDLGDLGSIRLEERFEEAENFFDTAPAALVHAEVELGGQRRRVDSYWDLVYSAARHNTGVRYWVVLDPPLDASGLPSSVSVVQIVAPDPFAGTTASVSLLDANFDVIVTPTIDNYDRTLAPERLDARFQRGDADASGEIDLGDALFVLNYLFRKGGTPTCVRAGDANDDGRLNVSDGVAILRHLFVGAGLLPTPFGSCGDDTTADNLDCQRFAACP